VLMLRGRRLAAPGPRFVGLGPVAENRKELGLGGFEAFCYRNHSTKACRERRKVDGSSETRRKASGGLIEFKGYSNGRRIASTAPMETGVSCWKL
jgi:hypothetical protein